MNKLLVTVLAIAQVLFAANIHCANCAKKVQENIAFEKGVKDLRVDVERKEIEITFNTSKTDTLVLRKAINKLGYSAEIKEYKIIK